MLAPRTQDSPFLTKRVIFKGRVEEVILQDDTGRQSALQKQTSYEHKWQDVAMDWVFTPQVDSQNGTFRDFLAGDIYQCGIGTKTHPKTMLFCVYVGYVHS